MEYHLKSTKTFRYFTQGNPDTARNLLIVMHGYGQLAQYFIRKFHGLDESYFIVAPEGMHRFYMNGSSGRVGASWMTKEDRETDIKDNLNWLNDLHDLFKDSSFDKRILFGFSQGGATAARWFTQSKISFDHLILWATVFPPDLNSQKELSSIQTTQNYFILGTEDEFYDQKGQNELLEFYDSLGFTCLIFNGKHDVHPETLQLALNSIKKGG